MKALSIRNVSPELAKALDRERRRTGASLNQTVLRLLRQALGVSSEGPFSNGLRELSGGWSAEEAREFERNVAAFEHIDEDAWR